MEGLRLLKSFIGRYKAKHKPPTPLLERVLGITASCSAAVAFDGNTSTIAYPAGRVVVLYNPIDNSQRHISHPNLKNISCLAFTRDGRFLVTGEEGDAPQVRVWSVKERNVVAEFKGHHHKVTCVAFNPNGNCVLSVGCEHDRQVCVWNWQRKADAVFTSTEQSQVLDLAFPKNKNNFVTVGEGHVKFWYLAMHHSQDGPVAGKPAALGKYQNHTFLSVCFGQTGYGADHVFCVSREGVLLKINDKREIVHFQLLKVQRVYCVRVSGNQLYVGCSNGLILKFSTETLVFLGQMPLPHHISGPSAQPCSAAEAQPSPCPDVVALATDRGHSLCVIHSDHSLYVWNSESRPGGAVSIARRFFFHSRGIRAIDVSPQTEVQSPGSPTSLGSFVTCSADDTLRMWSFYGEDDTAKAHPRSNRQQDISAHELRKIIYVDGGRTNDHMIHEMDQRTSGVRSLRISPDDRDMALGYCQGYIKIFDLGAVSWKVRMSTHKSDVLCLAFTRESTGLDLLASGGRDGLICIFNRANGYEIIRTLHYHSASVWAVCFREINNRLELISSGADRFLRFYAIDKELNSQLSPKPISGPGAFYDMGVDDCHGSVVTAGDDGYLRIYDSQTHEERKPVKASGDRPGPLIKAQLDPSGTYAVTSSTNNNLELIDIHNGTRLARMYGHSMLATDIKFLNDRRHFVTVSLDGCIFVWRLPEEFSRNISQRMKKVNERPYGVKRRNSLWRRRFSGASVEDMLEVNLTQSCPNLLTRNQTIGNNSSTQESTGTRRVVAGCHLDASECVRNAALSSIPEVQSDFPDRTHEYVLGENEEPETLTAAENMEGGGIGTRCGRLSEEELQDGFFQQYYNFAPPAKSFVEHNDINSAEMRSSSSRSLDACCASGQMDTGPMPDQQCIRSDGRENHGAQTQNFDDVDLVQDFAAHGDLPSECQRRTEFPVIRRTRRYTTCGDMRNRCAVAAAVEQATDLHQRHTVAFADHGDLPSEYQGKTEFPVKDPTRRYTTCGDIRSRWAAAAAAAVEQSRDLHQKHTISSRLKIRDKYHPDPAGNTSCGSPSPRPRATTTFTYPPHSFPEGNSACDDSSLAPPSTIHEEDSCRNPVVQRKQWGQPDETPEFARRFSIASSSGSGDAFELSWP